MRRLRAIDRALPSACRPERVRARAFLQIAVVWLGEMVDLFSPPYVRGGALPIKSAPPPTPMPGFFQNTVNLAIVVAAGGAALLIVGVALLCFCIKKRRATPVGSGAARFDYGLSMAGPNQVDMSLYHSAVHDAPDLANLARYSDAGCN